MEFHAIRNSLWFNWCEIICVLITLGTFLFTFKRWAVRYLRKHPPTDRQLAYALCLVVFILFNVFIEFSIGKQGDSYALYIFPRFWW